MHPVIVCADVFTLPGTGKSVTGARLAYLFVQRNWELHASKGTDKKLQVLYCGPSNKSVDVVTSKSNT